MYLDVKFTDGTITHIPVSPSHTVRVISPDNQVQDAFAFSGVASISLDGDGAPAATDPNPAPAAGAVEAVVAGSETNADTSATTSTAPSPETTDAAADTPDEQLAAS